MTLSRRSTIKAIGVAGAGSTFSGTVLAATQEDGTESDEEPSDDEYGSIRIGHFVPDAPNVDVYVDDQQILSDVAFGDLSPYLDIEPGTYTVSIAPTGEDEAVYQQTVPVETGYYTAAAVGEFEGGAQLAEADDANETDVGGDGFDFGGNESDMDGNVSDDLEVEAGIEDGAGGLEFLVLADRRPDDIEQEGTTPVRLVHAAPDVPTVDVADAENGMTIYEDVAFSEPSGYVPLDPDLEGLALFPADDADESDEGDGNETDGLGEDEVISQEDPVAVIDFDLESDQVYTAYLIGYLEGEEGIEVEAELAEDEDDDDDQREGGDDEQASDETSFAVRLALDGTTDTPESDDADDEQEAAVDGNGDSDEEDAAADDGGDDADHGHGGDDHGSDGNESGERNETAVASAD